MISVRDLLAGGSCGRQGACPAAFSTIVDNCKVVCLVVGQNRCRRFQGSAETQDLNKQRITALLVPCCWWCSAKVSDVLCEQAHGRVCKLWLGQVAARSVLLKLIERCCCLPSMLQTHNRASERAWTNAGRRV